MLPLAVDPLYGSHMVKEHLLLLYCASVNAFQTAYIAVMCVATDLLFITPSGTGSLSSMTLESLGCFPNTSWKLLKPPWAR